MTESRRRELKEKYRLGGSPAIGLTGATIGFFIGFAAVALFGTTAKKFDALMHLSPLMLGVLVAIPSLSGSILRIPFGAWTDKVGARVPILTLLGVSIAGMAGLTALLYASYPSGIGPSSIAPLFLPPSYRNLQKVIGHSKSRLLRASRQVSGIADCRLPIGRR